MTCPKSHGEKVTKPRLASSRILLLSEVRRGSGFGAGVLALANDPLWPPGTLFLWIFWPSFNSALLNSPNERKFATFNTYYALAVSAVTAISVSALAHPQGKINMVRRWGAVPLAAPGSSRLIHTLFPQCQPHGLGKSLPGDGALSAVSWSVRTKQVPMVIRVWS